MWPADGIILTGDEGRRSAAFSVNNHAAAAMGLDRCGSAMSSTLIDFISLSRTAQRPGRSAGPVCAQIIPGEEFA